MTEQYSKTKTSFYRRLWVASLIEDGVNTVPLIIEATGMPIRTLQGVLLALPEIDIQFSVKGGTKNRSYSITSWGIIDKEKVKKRLQHIKEVLE